MSKFRTSPLHALLAAAILGLLVMPLAFAGAADRPGATTSAVTDKQFKKLKKRVAQLEGRSTAPSGPATGDLTGTYPNPQIADGAVTAGTLGTIDTVSANISDSDGVLNDNLWTRSSVATATCPAGSTLLAGGVTQIGSPAALTPEVAIARSAPNGANGWSAAIVSDAQGQADGPNNFVVRALCLQG